MQVPDFESLHPCFGWIRQYLEAVSPPHALPGRQHISPHDLRRLLPLLNLVDVLRITHDPRQDLSFRMRLVGTTQTAVAGREITGRMLEDAVLPEYVDRIRRNMQTVVTERRPVYDRYPMPHPGREFIDTERIYFPLAGDGRTVDMILIVHGYPADPELMPLCPPKALETLFG